MEEYKRVGENLFIRKATGKYYAIINKNRRRTTKSLKTTIRAIADARLNNLRMELGAANINPRPKDIPSLVNAIKEVLGQALKEVQKQKMSPNTYNGIKWHLDLVGESHLGAMKVSHIHTSALKDYLDKRRVDKSGRSAQVDMTHLKRVFSLAKDRGWRWDNPIEDIKPYKHTSKKIQIPDSEEIAKVLNYLRTQCHYKTAGKKAADFIEFLCLSGCRAQGAQTIKWEDIDFNKGVMTVTEKGNKSRQVDLFDGLRKFLEARREASGLLFPASKRKGRNSKPTTPYSPKKALQIACDKTKVVPFNFHSCRHYFATQCLEQGITPSTIAGWLGHVDNGILVMRLYGNHLKRRHFASEAQKVKISLGGKSTLPSVNPVSVNVASQDANNPTVLT
jgi:integrase